MVQAALLHEAKTPPVALLDGNESLLEVVACNESARTAGVNVGMTKIQAEVCGVSLRSRIQEHEDRARAELADCAYRFSPKVESTAAGTVIFDLAGSERLLGTGRTLAQVIQEDVANRGFEANVSLATNPDAALCAARGFNGITVIEPNDEAKRLGSLPVKVLDLEQDVSEVLDAWGITWCKELAALPSIPLTERLGQYGLHLQRLAKGAVIRELMPAPLPVPHQESTELEEPVELLEPLAFVLKDLLNQLMCRLIERSLATDQIEVDLSLEIHSDRDINAPVRSTSLAQYQRTIKLPLPTQDTKVLLKLMRLDLAAHPPHAPVKKIRIEAIPARIRYTQAGLFQPLAPEPARLEISLARLRAVVGETDSANKQRVGFPSLLDSLRPDHFEVTPLGTKQVTGELSSRLALRRFRPVIPVRVEVNDCWAPVWIGFGKKKGRVSHASGPWRGHGEWWDAAGEWSRDEWDIEVTVDGQTALYRIFHDLMARGWFVDGVYD